MNEQINAGLNAVKDFLAGKSSDEKVGVSDDKETREVVAAELLGTMSGRTANSTSAESSENAWGQAQETAGLTAGAAVCRAKTENATQEESDRQGNSVEFDRAENSTGQEQERARQLFLDHGYFDEAVQNLRAASSASERVAAAQALGLVGSQRATAHLIAAMFDDHVEVRNAAQEALRQIGDPVETGVSARRADEIKKAAAAASTESSVKEEEPIANAVEADEASLATANEMVEVAADSGVLGQAENASQGPLVTPEIFAEPVVRDAALTGEEEHLLLEEQTIRASLADIEQQIVANATASKELENEVRWRTEREAKLRADAHARRLVEEELRKRAEQEAEVQRAQERDAVASEQAARLKAEAEAQRFVEEEASLRLKAATLRLLLQQANVSMARVKAAANIAASKEEQRAVETAQHAEAERLRREAEKKNSEAEEQLRADLESLDQTREAVERRRSEVEAARDKADAQAQRLVEAQARMRAAEKARAEAEIERAQLEAEINQQVQTKLGLLDEVRLRGEKEQERLQEQVRLRTEKEQQRLAELEVMKTWAEVESRERAERERQVLGQIDSLRIADSETRRRIADAEVRRRAAEDAYRGIAEKVQRVEAEAHARAKEEERMLQKLESERRNAAIEAQSRAEQEKRIRHEIEMFRRLEEEERPRVEAAALRLADAEARLQERKDRLKEDEEARSLAQDELTAFTEFRGGSAERQEQPEALPPDESSRLAAIPLAVPEAGVTSNFLRADGGNSDEPVVSVVTPAISSYLSSVDPYKRAAAVAELARSGSSDAFIRIADCFDDASPHVRNAAARALRKLEPDKVVDLFNRALEQASPERRRNIGAAIAASGLATEAINNLAGESREDTYKALSILFVMAKTGEVEPLVRAFEEHRDDEIGKAVSKLLTLSGHQVRERAAGADGRI